MRKKIMLWLQKFSSGPRRFPLAWLAAILAICAAVCLNHKYHFGNQELSEGYLYRMIMLWPIALFGNVALRLRAEREGRSPAWGILFLSVLLIATWFCIPLKPDYIHLAFWFGYGALITRACPKTCVFLNNI